MKYTIELELSEEEEKLLARLADIDAKLGLSAEPIIALKSALLIGRRWDTYYYEKLADALWGMHGCSYDECEQLKDDYKQKMKDDFETFKKEKTSQYEMEILENQLQEVEMEPEDD